jgi:hypothetical protein
MHVTDDWLRERAAVHRSTVARWRAQRQFPPALVRLAALELEGRLELIHAAWAGFSIDARSGELVMPGGERYRAGEILALPIRAQQLRELERRLSAADRHPSVWRRALLLCGFRGSR